MRTLRNMVIFFLSACAFLLLQSSIAHAAPLGYAYNGVCYADMNTAAVAFINHYPNQQSFLMYDIASVNIGVPAANAITYQLAMTNLSTGGTQLLPAVSMSLHPCESTVVDNGGVDRVIVTLAAVFAFFFGFSVGRSFSSKHVFSAS